MRARAPATEPSGASAQVVPSPLSRGSVLCGWRLLEHVGSGGTADVWHAVDGRGREAALKIPKPPLRLRAATSELVRREHARLEAVASPHLVRPLALVEWQGTRLIALEYLPGGDLVPFLGAPPGQWLPALRDVTAALQALHGAGLAHGDVKARNVLFGADGRARLVDLTAARALDAPATVTTAAYAVPALATATSRDADLFALAALLYELLAGRPPYGARGSAALGVGPAVVTVVGPAAQRLLAAADAVLRAGGRTRGGLSRLGDVIESVGPV